MFKVQSESEQTKTLSPKYKKTYTLFVKSARPHVLHPHWQTPLSILVTSFPTLLTEVLSNPVCGSGLTGRICNLKPIPAAMKKSLKCLTFRRITIKPTERNERVSPRGYRFGMQHTSNKNQTRKNE